jgi:uncharacterized membrane protein YkoI
MALFRIASNAALIALPIAFLAAAWAGPAQAAEHARHSCLNKEAQREAVASRQAVALAQALRAARVKHKGELVRARLCRRPNGLVYVLTLLPRNGKVTRAFVDAASGQLVGSR